MRVVRRQSRRQLLRGIENLSKKQFTKMHNRFWLVASKEEKSDGHQTFRRGRFFHAIAEYTYYTATKERKTL